MLEKIDLTKELVKEEWKELRPALQHQLYDLERAGFEAGMPTIIVFEGWDASGKGTTINMLTQRLDPPRLPVLADPGGTHVRAEPSLAVALLAQAAQSTARSRSSTAVGMAECWWSGSKS